MSSLLEQVVSQRRGVLFCWLRSSITKSHEPRCSEPRQLNDLSGERVDAVPQDRKQANGLVRGPPSRRWAPWIYPPSPRSAGSRADYRRLRRRSFGIGTYSQAGAQLGFGIGWTMLLTFPLMVAIQEISARIGRTTGHGIAGNLCRHYPGWLLYAVVALLVRCQLDQHRRRPQRNGGCGSIADRGSGRALRDFAWDAPAWTAIVFMSYARYVWMLKWMTLTLFAYVAALFATSVPWGEALLRCSGAAHHLEQRLLHHSSCDLRDDHLPLPVFLAGVAGGRGSAYQTFEKPLIRAPKPGSRSL